LLLGEIGKIVEEIAEDQFVGIAQIGVVLQAGKKGREQWRVCPGCVRLEGLFQLVQTIAVLLEENPGHGAHALAIPLVQSRGIVHQDDDHAVGIDAVVDTGGDRGSTHRGGGGWLGRQRLRRGRDGAQRERGDGGNEDRQTMDAHTVAGEQSLQRVLQEHRTTGGTCSQKKRTSFV
jgi:hypothetical protein